MSVGITDRSYPYLLRQHALPAWTNLVFGQRCSGSGGYNCLTQPVLSEPPKISKVLHLYVGRQGLP